MSESVSQKARRRRNVAAGLCKCGRPRKPRKRRCERCLADASRWSYKKRYGGLSPVAVCARCLLGVRARRAWAMPGSPFCVRHQLTAGDADRAAVRQADRIRAGVRRARDAGRPVDSVFCGCGKHLVNTGEQRCWVCASGPRHKGPRLTARQQRFVEEYLVDLKAAPAAIRAGYASKTAETCGPRLLRFAQVAEAIAKAKEERAVRTGITAERVLAELELLAFSDVTHYVVDDAGVLRAIERLPADVARKS